MLARVTDALRRSTAAETSTSVADVSALLTDFNALWEHLRVHEQEQFIRALVRQVNYDGMTESVCHIGPPHSVSSGNSGRTHSTVNTVPDDLKSLTFFLNGERRSGSLPHIAKRGQDRLPRITEALALAIRFEDMVAERRSEGLC